LGQALQIYYLKNHGLTKGPSISNYIQKYKSGEDIPQQLTAWFNRGQGTLLARLVRGIKSKVQGDPTGRLVRNHIATHLGQVYPKALKSFYRELGVTHHFKNRSSFWFSE
jgi:hypothetical protein